ncbi:MAG TPA: hypothetical protein VLH35_03040 [Candidatus Acidoferrales bacterium]|nr:hypothetical protein [Candidatus Acidoferrales bacterium]
MTQSKPREGMLSEGLITALAFGGFFITVGVVFGLTPGITGALSDFFADFTGVTYPVTNGHMVLPAPAHPAAHATVYQAVFNFMVCISILQVVILAARLWVHSTIKRLAETVGNMVFWIGGALVAYVYLMAGTTSGWFTFWPSIIILAGASLITQGLVYYAKRRR